MKTAVSIPDRLFRRAEATARRLGISRSRLFSMAVEEFLDSRSTESVTATLDRVYAGQDSGLDVVLERIETRSLPEDRW